MDDFLRSDFVGDVVIIILVIVAIRFIVKMIKKSDDKRAEAARHPKTDAQKELVREVIAAIERDAPDFYEAEIDISRIGTGSIQYNSRTATYRYSFDEHGYSVSKEMAYILACQIADHFGGRYELNYGCYCIAGPSKLALEREQKRQEELERQRIENLKHL